MTLLRERGDALATLPPLGADHDGDVELDEGRPRRVDHVGERAQTALRLGAAIAGHLVAIEPLASTDFEVLVDTVDPLIEHYLLGDLDQSAADVGSPSEARAVGER